MEWEAGRPLSTHVGVCVPCRRCTVCLENRAELWGLRMAVETVLSHRTWLSTFTLRPDCQYEALAVGLKKLGLAGVETTPEQELKARHVGIASLFVTPYWKRVRKQSGHTLRICQVMELTEAGLPHYHALVHEPDEFNTVTKRILQEQWHAGFCDHKLVENPKGAASYVAKYLTKAVKVGRVRASLRYGRV